MAQLGRDGLPVDYHFLRWFWDRESAAPHDCSALMEQYKRETGRFDPYEELDSEDEAADACRTFAEELKRKELPWAVELVTRGANVSHASEAVHEEIVSAVAAYYGSDYARGALGRDEDARAVARLADPGWAARVGRAFRWYWRLPVETPEEGTTNPEQVFDLRSRYSALTALYPSSRYLVLPCREGGGYAYADQNGEELRCPTHPALWDDAVVAELINGRDLVVGVFAYETRRAAELAQEARVPRETRARGE